MSRPPISGHFPRVSSGDPGHYLQLRLPEYAALARDMARRELGVPAGGEGDPLEALIDLSAVTAHLLSLQQLHHAREAFLPTARSAAAQAAHGRKLGWVADPPLSARALGVATVRKAGTLPAGAAARAEGGQVLELAAELAVDPRLDAMALVDRMIPVSPGGSSVVLLEGVGHRLRPGDVVVLVGPDDAPVVGQARRLVTYREDRAAGQSEVQVDLPWTLPGAMSQGGSLRQGWRLLAEPRRNLRAFGWDVDPEAFPVLRLKKAGAYGTNGIFDDGYIVNDVGNSYAALEGDEAFFLVGEGQPEPQSWWVGDVAGQPVAVRVEKAQRATLSFKRVSEHFTAPGWVVHFQESGGHRIRRQVQPWHMQWSGDCAKEIRVRSLVPDPAPWVGPELRLDLPDPPAILAPGRRLMLSAGAAQTLVRVQQVEVVGGQTVLSLSLTGAEPPMPRGQLRVDGNIVELVEGETRKERLPPSDGSPRQVKTFRLNGIAGEAGEQGILPMLQLWVDGIRWSLVEHFAFSGPEDRHFRVEWLPDARAGTVGRLVFGDGRRGAIPPRSEENMLLIARCGGGSRGNLPAQTPLRWKEERPESAGLRLPWGSSGGVEAGSPAEAGGRAVHLLKTLDRAVSVQDHADLALRFPGVAQATARQTPDGILQVVVAGAGGQPHASQDLLRSWLESRRDPVEPLQLMSASPLPVQLRVQVQPRAGVRPQQAEAALRRALCGDTGLLSFGGRKLGQAAFLSELYHCLEGLPELERVRILAFGVAGGAVGTAHVVPASHRQWIQLVPSELRVEALAPEAP